MRSGDAPLAASGRAVPIPIEMFDLYRAWIPRQRQQQGAAAGRWISGTDERCPRFRAKHGKADQAEPKQDQKHPREHGIHTARRDSRYVGSGLRGCDDKAAGCKAIVAACKDAWDFLISDPARIRSIGTRAWPYVNTLPIRLKQTPTSAGCRMLLDPPYM